MCNRMTVKGKRKSVYVAAAVILMCYLLQTIDCYRLKKTERQERQKEADAAKTIGFQEGKIVLGRVFENGSGLESQITDGTKKLSSNASVEDDVAYQADFTGWLQRHTQDASSAEASWKRMAPSLQCGGDQMRFRAVGPGASQFAVAQGNAPPMPLSKVPSTCGYNMQRNSLGLVMLVPYDGCNMFQEGGSYVLPMSWQGVPVSLWCPKPAATVPQPITQHPSNPQRHQVPLMPRSSKGQHPHSHIFPPFLTYPKNPSTPEPATTTKKPEMPRYPSYSPEFQYFPFHHFFPPPVTTAAPTTADPPKVPFNPLQFPPYMYFVPPYNPLFQFRPYQTTTPQTTTKKTVAPHFHPHGHLPFLPYDPRFPAFMPPYVPYPTPKPKTTTPASTTTKKTVAPHFHPHGHLPFHPYDPRFMPPFVPYPTAKPKTTTPASTTTKKTVAPHFHPHGHLPFLPYDPRFPAFMPPYVPYPTPKPKTTTPASTTTKKTVAPHFHPHGHLPFHPYDPRFMPPFVPYPTPKPKTTTPASTTTKKTVVPHFHPHGHLPFHPYDPRFMPPFVPYPTPKPKTTTPASTTTTDHDHPHFHMPFPHFG